MYYGDQYVTLTAEPDQDSYLLGIFDVPDNNLVSRLSPHAFTMPFEDIQYLARFRPNPYIVINQKYIDENGDSLKTEELISIVSDLNIGGNETTTDSLGSGMLMLLQKPDKMKALISGEVKYKNFIEEIIRLETPVQSLFRRVRKEVTLSGVTIPEGSMIDMRFGSANRDEEQFECPMDMVLDRKNPGKHLAYGTAHHHCIGAPLARQEMRLAFEILLKRLKNIQLDKKKNDLLHRSHFALRGLNKLYLTFERA